MRTPAPTGGDRRPGRPRSADADAAILTAALALLAEHGYAGMTVDGVAAAAGVGKATIYLRYRSKADLATAALAHLRESAPPAATDDPRADLVALMRVLRHNAEKASVLGLVGTCLAEEHNTPELLDLFRERTIAPRRAALAAILERAQTAGLLAAGTDVSVVVDLLWGAFQARYTSGEPFPDAWEKQAVAVVLGAEPDEKGQSSVPRDQGSGSPH